MLKTILILAIFIGFPAFGAGLPEFCGVYRLDDETRFLLIATDSETSSGWMPLGATFEGYTLLAFDMSERRLVLGKAGRESEVFLREASPSEFPSRLTTTLRVRANNVLQEQTLILADGEESVVLLAENITVAIIDRLLADGTRAYTTRFEKRGAPTSIVVPPVFVAGPGQPIMVQFENMSIELTPSS